MNEDLRWLAENVHEWAHNDCDLIRNHCESASYAESKNHLYPRGMYYTRAQWQAARDELSGKPSWDDAPEWVEWIAQWSDGQWIGYEIEPVCGDNDDPDDCYVDPRETPRVHYFGYGETLTDWRKTLERRPENHSVEPTEKVWRGPEDGLPPVGVECEFRKTNVNYVHKFVKVTPMFFGETIVVLKHCASGNEFSEKLNGVEFRPIRSEEDKAVEAMLCIMEGGSGELAARALYRAGYRKQEVE